MIYKYIIIRKMFNQQRESSSGESEWWIGLCYVALFAIFLIISIVMSIANGIDLASLLFFTVMFGLGIVFFSWMTYECYKDEKRKQSTQDLNTDDE